MKLQLNRLLPGISNCPYPFCLERLLITMWKNNVRSNYIDFVWNATRFLYRFYQNRMSYFFKQKGYLFLLIDCKNYKFNFSLGKMSTELFKQSSLCWSLLAFLSSSKNQVVGLDSSKLRVTFWLYWGQQ